MTENDEQLLMRFFDEQRQDIADNGFTQQVMRHLPARTMRINRWWTVLCWAIGIAFFFLVDGVGQLRQVASSLFSDVLSVFSSINLPFLNIVIVSIVLLVFLTIEVYRLAEDY